MNRRLHSSTYEIATNDEIHKFFDFLFSLNKKDYIEKFYEYNISDYVTFKIVDKSYYLELETDNKNNKRKSNMYYFNEPRELIMLNGLLAILGLLEWATNLVRQEKIVDAAMKNNFK